MKIKLLFFGIVMIFSESCSLLSGVKDEVDPTGLLPKALNKPLTEKTVTDAALKYSPNVLDSLKTFLSKEQSTTYYDEEHMDSVRQVLIDSGSVKVNMIEGILLKDYLPSEEKSDTIYLANLFSETDTKGNPISFQYEVKKNDLILFSFENIKSKNIQSLELIEGNQIRYQFSNLGRNKNVEGSFRAISDNLLILNIVKKGFFSSNVKIQIARVPQRKKLSIVREIDTVKTKRMVFEQVVDTLFTISEDKHYTLKPALDITGNNEIKVPISFAATKNLIGWGYWIGLEKKDQENFETLADLDPNKNPLITFAYTELNRKKIETFLPESENDEVEIDFYPVTKDSISINSKPFYAFFTTDSLSSLTKANLSFINNSKLNGHEIYLRVVQAYLAFSNQEIEKELYKPQFRLNIKYE
tara:strand:- start:4523 stop:5764 length:1242 start_codon:yes stop_codon:yes gene_type:complete